jgi:hypothetical protein
MAKVFRATVKARHGDGTLIQPSLHYQSDLEPLEDEPTAQEVADGLWSKWGTQLRTCHHTTVVFDELVVTEEVLPPDIPSQASKAVAANGTLTSGAFDLPKGLVVLLGIKTTTPSRSARSHLALGCPGPATFLGGGVWTSSVITPAQAFCDLLNDDVEVGGPIITHTMHPVVYSRTRRKRGESPYTFRVSNAVARPTPHWLRSRMSQP